MRDPATYRQNGRPPAKPPTIGVHQFLDEEDRRYNLAKMQLSGRDVSHAFFALTTEIAHRILDGKRAPGFKDHRWLRSVKR